GGEPSFAGVRPHAPSSAARAASTARSTSPSPAIAAFASGSPVAGSRSSRTSPEAGSTSAPSMKSPYSRCVATAIGPTIALEGHRLPRDHPGETSRAAAGRRAMDQAAVAAPAEQDRHARRLGVTKAVLSAPLTITIVGALLGSQLIPAWTNHLQDHKQRLEVRTQLANDMTDAFTNALAITSSSGSGYTAGVGTWLAASGKARAELTARYGDGGITAD